MKKLPQALFFSIILFLISQGFLINSPSFWRKVLLYSRPLFDSPIRFEAQLKLLPDKKSENTRILLFGSSLINDAFDVNYLNSEFSSKGIKFYKLTYPFCYPYDIFQLQKRIVTKNPDLIIILTDLSSFYTPYSGYSYWGRAYPYNILWPFIFEPSIIPYLVKHLGMCEIIKERNVWINVVINKLSFVFKHRLSLRYLIEAQMKDFFTGKKREFSEYYFDSNWTESRFQEALASHNNKKRFEKSKLTGFNEEMFRIFVKFILQNKIKLLIIDGPTHYLLKKTYDNKLDILYNAFLSNQAKELNFIYLSKDKLPMFEPSDFIDFEHLNENGRKKMTEFLESYLENNFGKKTLDK